MHLFQKSAASLGTRLAALLGLTWAFSIPERNHCSERRSRARAKSNRGHDRPAQHEHPTHN
jgi:hypothetical protein